MTKELASLRTIIKCIEEHDLESQYPRDGLKKYVGQLEKQKADRKRPASGPGPIPKKKQQQQHSRNKRHRASVSMPIATATTTTTSVAQFSYAHLQPEGFLQDGVVMHPYMMSSSSSQCQLVGSAPAPALAPATASSH